MVLHVLRALFVLLMAAVGWFFVRHNARPFGDYTWLALSFAVSLAILFIFIDIISPRKKLAIFSGTILGLLVGLFVAYALSFVVDMMADQYLKLDRHRAEAMVQFTKLCIGVTCCYLAVSFILQTKDDFRFIVPYVEFARQVRGARPIVVDTSVIIDGRINEIAETGFIESRLIVPRFVLQELQTIADHGDRLKRQRGRRGLDVLNKLQNNRRVEVILYDWTGHASPEAEEGADQKLLALSKELNARLLTTDFNLSKVAQVRGIDVINLNDLGNALRPNVLPGERMRVRVVKPGEDTTQGVGFLDDGTMVVIEQGRAHLNQEVEFTVTNVLQTAGGRMIFGRIGAAAGEVVTQGARKRGRAEDGDAG